MQRNTLLHLSGSRGRRAVILGLAAFVFLVITLIVAGCSKPDDDAPPLDYGVLMREIGSRYKDLYVAAQQEKWEFAEYQAKKINFLVEKSALVNPAAAKDTGTFLEGAYPAILDAISTKDKEQFEAGYQEFNSLCNTCHTSQNVGYLTLEIPSVSDSPVLAGATGEGDGEAGAGGGADGSGGGAAVAKADVEKACTGCHDAERIKAAAHSGVDAWKGVVERMKAKGAAVNDVQGFSAYLDQSKGMKQ